ncbi:MAG: radical SAM protein [Myxococcota bacterium]|nr:radical SAM protein [Myxococcota bacterium]
MRRRLPEPVWIDIGGATRASERLDEVAAPLRAGADVLADIADAGPHWMLTGGEPTLRSDLPALLTGGGLRTDGLLLGRPGVLAGLKRAGLQRVRVRIHSSRPDAHDWLSGAQGSLRHALRGLQACARAGVPTEAEITITRPTIGHLDETVALACRLGVRGVVLRRLTAQGAAAADFIALSPRLGLLQGPLAGAMAAADAAGVPSWTEGIPTCMAPPARPQAKPMVRDPGCASCPPGCPGYPADYAARFGRAELLRVAGAPSQEQIRVVIAPDEETRDVRRRLVAAAMCRPQTLRVIGVASHPACADLLRELLRLSVPRVEVCGVLDGLASLSGADQLRLRGLARIDAALLAPTAAAHDAVVGRPGAFAAVKQIRGVQCYGIARSGKDARAFLASGITDLRLAAPGGLLSELPSASALLPPCLGGIGSSPPPVEAFHGSTPAGRQGSPEDRLGAALPCPHAEACSASERCPGLAVGWSSAGVAPL